MGDRSSFLEGIFSRPALKNLGGAPLIDRNEASESWNYVEIGKSGGGKPEMERHSGYLAGVISALIESQTGLAWPRRVSTGPIHHPFNFTHPERTSKRDRSFFASEILTNDKRRPVKGTIGGKRKREREKERKNEKKDEKGSRRESGYSYSRKELRREK